MYKANLSNAVGKTRNHSYIPFRFIAKGLANTLTAEFKLFAG